MVRRHQPRCLDGSVRHRRRDIQVRVHHRRADHDSSPSPHPPPPPASQALDRARWLVAHASDRRIPSSAADCLPVGSDVFGMRAQRFSPYLHASQFFEQPGCLTEGGDGTQRRLPARQAGARLLIGRQFQRLVGWAPAMAAAPAVMPPPIHSNRTQTPLYTSLAQRLHAAPLLAPWTFRCNWTRIVLQSGRTQSQHGFQPRLQLLQASGNPTILGDMELPGRVNYLGGSDPDEWRTDIPTYGLVQYKDIYPGIDLCKSRLDCRDLFHLYRSTSLQLSGLRDCRRQRRELVRHGVRQLSQLADDTWLIHALVFQD